MKRRSRNLTTARGRPVLSLLEITDRELMRGWNGKGTGSDTMHYAIFHSWTSQLCPPDAVEVGGFAFYQSAAAATACSLRSDRIACDPTLFL